MKYKLFRLLSLGCAAMIIILSTIFPVIICYIVGMISIQFIVTFFTCLITAGYGVSAILDN